MRNARVFKKQFLIIIIILVACLFSLFVVIYYNNPELKAKQIAALYIKNDKHTPIKKFNNINRSDLMYLYGTTDGLLSIHITKDSLFSSSVYGIDYIPTQKYDNNITPVEIYYFSKNKVCIYGYCYNDTIKTIQATKKETNKSVYVADVDSSGFFSLVIDEKIIVGFKIDCLDAHGNLVYGWSY